MKAMILAAGLGTRLRPWTLTHPKALVPVEKVPMLARVIERLIHDGFGDITVNVHHFASQITDYLAENHFNAEIHVSDETGRLLETGGGILHAREFLGADNAPFLVHNVDILSNAPLSSLMQTHIASGSDATLLVSKRKSSRKLWFATDNVLAGWSSDSGETRPANFCPGEGMACFAFSGIYVMNPRLFPLMERQFGSRPFSIMDFFLANTGSLRIRGYVAENLEVLDIGKPETLANAPEMLARIS